VNGPHLEGVSQCLGISVSQCEEYLICPCASVLSLH
jgi:hypothetical protein